MAKKLSKVLVLLGTEDHYSGPRLGHWCPACKEVHPFAVDEAQKNGARWTWDGNEEKPTFAPSMNITCGPFYNDDRIERCHYFLRNGVIEYLDDCTHDLRGQRVELPEIPLHLLYGWGLTK